MLLTAKDLAELTDCKRRQGQIEWLQVRGWPFEIGTKGRPKVLRSVMEARMGGVASPTKIEPNFGALHGA